MDVDFADTLELSVRSANVLKAHGIKTKAQFLALTKAEVLRWPNAGRKTWKEISELQHYFSPEYSIDQLHRMAAFHAREMSAKLQDLQELYGQEVVILVLDDKPGVKILREVVYND